jgi:methylated-DNA-[protein]-cysteine S-methyltransferase
MAETRRLLVDRLETPIGQLILVADEEALLRFTHWAEGERRLLPLLRRSFGEEGFVLQPANNPFGLTAAMREYFAGELGAIDHMSVEMSGTPFQRTVWRALRDIPCGTTLSYSALAQRIGRPSAVRAVGLANGANPVGVVVPCHRVVGANGTLTGYGGGIERKRWLLAHEGVGFHWKPEGTHDDHDPYVNRSDVS